MNQSDLRDYHERQSTIPCMNIIHVSDKAKALWSPNAISGIYHSFVYTRCGQDSFRLWCIARVGVLERDYDGMCDLSV